MIQDFPGSPVVTPCASTARGKGSIPGGRTKISEAKVAGPKNPQNSALYLKYCHI